MTVVLFLTILFFASIVQGVAGFGYAAVSVPLVLLFLPKETMVVSYAVISVVLNAMLFFRIRARFPLVRLLPFLVASIIGLPVGIILLSVVSQQALTVGAALISLAMIVFIVRRDIVHFPRSGVVSTAVGFAIGVIQTSAAINGPLSVAYMTNVMQDRKTVRRSLAGVFLLLAISSIVFLSLSGTWTLSRAAYGLYGIPVVLGGATVGNRLADRISLKWARQITIALIVITALNALINNLGIFR